MLSLALFIFAFGPRESFFFAASAIAILGVGFAALLLMPTAILADIVDYDTVASGEKRAGLFMAIFKFSSKVSMALSVGIAYGILDLIGFDAQGGNGEFGILAIKSVGLGIPALFIIPGILLMLRFPIGRKEHAEIRKKIEAM